MLKCAYPEELRRTINAATNIAAAWNGFVQWLALGGDGVIRQHNREEQRKILRSNHEVGRCRTRSHMSSSMAELR